MEISISEMAKLTGVSVRTLHYYHEIGLLSPSFISDTSYRYYDEESIEKLQQIMFYRELDFSLKEIIEIMNSPDYKKEEALKRQKELLKLKKQRLDNLITLLDANLKGEKSMSFKEFDMAIIDEAKEKYADEVREKWGKTDVYTQSEKRTKNYTKEDWERVTKKSEEIIQKFSKKVGEDPKSNSSQNLVKEWQDFITESYYDCTDEILKGLGEMYVADERFKKNLDKYKEGTAEFMRDAINIFVER